MRRTALTLLAALVLASFAATARAQEEPADAGGVLVSTPFPAVAVEPGETATFNLNVGVPSAQRVDLAVEGAPEGWTTTLRGGGFVVDGIFVDPAAETPPAVTLDVAVPPEAGEEVTELTVTADGETGLDELTLSLRISATASGSITLDAEFPQLSASSGEAVTFNVELRNDTPAEREFALEAQAADGWLATARPSTEAQASTVTVEGGGTATINVEVTPPTIAAAGQYRVIVTAISEDDTAQTELIVDLTGSFAMRLTTQDERLNAEVSAGAPTNFPFLVVNDGTAPLTQVTLTATPPPEWEVTFDPAVVEEVAPGDFMQVTAVITPAGNALAGDYVLNINASAQEGAATADVEIRTSVQTSSILGILGIVLIAVALLVLLGVFRRFGRR